MKKFSIITVNYNNCEGLQKTINSVLEQNFQDFEFIIIDGGSTDGSKQIIEDCNRVDYWVSEKDTGIYNAMNKGIIAAKGEYLIFMNGGDCFYSANVLNNIKNEFVNTIDILYGNAFFVEEKQQFQVDYPKKLNFSFFYTNSLCHQATFYKRDIFDNNLYNEDLKIVSDWEFNIKSICAYNKTYKHIDEVICYYNLDGISHHQKENDNMERKIVLEKYFSAFLEDYKTTIGQLIEFNKPQIKHQEILPNAIDIGNVTQKRLEQFVYISKNNKILYKILKAIINIGILFSSKENRN